MSARLGVALATFLAATLLAWTLSYAPLYSDDVQYAVTALSTRGNPLTVLWPFPWLGHFRPGLHLAWWLTEPWLVDGSGVRFVQCALWGGLVAVLAWGSERKGPTGWLPVVIGIVANPVFIELLGWKSWLGQMGTLAGLGAGLVLLAGDKPRPIALLLVGLGGLLFKETGTIVLAVAALVTGPRPIRIVGGALLLAGAAAVTLVPFKVASGVPVLHLWDNIAHCADFAWLLPLAVVAIRPEAPLWWQALAACAAVLPDRLAGVAVLVAAGAIASTHRPSLVAWGLAWGAPLLLVPAPQAYLLDGAVVLVALLALRGPALPRTAFALAFLAALPGLATVPAGLVDRYGGWAAEHAFFREFHPQRARELRMPKGAFLEADIVVWMADGARIRGPIKPGTKPTQVGPLSGVWADPLPLAPGESQPEVTLPPRPSWSHPALPD